MPTPTTTTGLHHTAVFVTDLEKSITFYTEAFGLTLRCAFPFVLITEGPLQGQTIAPNGAMLDTYDGSLIELFPRPADAPIQSPVFPLNHLALRTSTVSEAYQRALDHGATPHTFTRDEGDWDGSPLSVEFQGDSPAQARIAFVRGLDQELIELFETDSL